MEFINKSVGTKNGFAHISQLFNDGELLAEVKLNYLNRTWEAYQFQSSMQQAVHMAIEAEVLREKSLRGISSLTKAKREEIINESKLIQQLKEIKL
jgi:hypothetical protein